MSDRMKTYKTHPMSLVFNILTKIAVVLTISVFVLIVGYVVIKGVPYLKPSLFAKTYTTENVSMLPAIVNTFEMLLVSLAIAAPLGIFCAIYLVEYAKKGNKFVRVIRLTTETLSGIPSIVYGLFGNMFFVLALTEAVVYRFQRFLGRTDYERYPLRRYPCNGKNFRRNSRSYLYRRNYRQVCRPYRLRTYPFYPYVFTFKRGTLYERSKRYSSCPAGSSSAS